MRISAAGGACLPAALAFLLASAVALAAGPARQTCDTSRYPLSSPVSRFEDHGDGTVTDKLSNLMWMRCAAGQNWVKGACVGSPTPLTWAAAQAAAAAIDKDASFFYSDWRVPQIPELATIAERQCTAPRINLTIFPDTPAEFFWTSSSRQGAGAETYAFALSFGTEGVKYGSKEERHDVRLVRTAP